MWDDEVEGDVADVHQSLLEPQRLWGAPYMPALGNLMLAFTMIFGAHLWYWALVAVKTHLVLWLVTRRDIFAIESLRQYCSFAAYYEVY